jgi:4-hydroxybenzoate polyprenyl transferase
MVLLNFSRLTIIVALGSMPLAFLYPLIKRYTYWPQLLLGFTFNYGLILGWICIKNNLDITPVVFYLGAIFWTLGFDTIYGFQDMKDDEIIGIKSTSIKFKKNPKNFLSLCYLIFIASLITLGILMKFNLVYFLFLLFPIIHLLFYQKYTLKTENEKSCLNIFKSNNFLGSIIFVNLFIGKLIA